jgi:hypothetical protein
LVTLDLRPDDSVDHDERENNNQPWITLGQVRDDKSFSSQIFYNLAESINDQMFPRLHLQQRKIDTNTLSKKFQKVVIVNV